MAMKFLTLSVRIRVTPELVERIPIQMKGSLTFLVTTQMADVFSNTCGEQVNS